MCLLIDFHGILEQFAREESKTKLCVAHLQVTTNKEEEWLVSAFFILIILALKLMVYFVLYEYISLGANGKYL